jgi:hypothetical protein
MGTGRAGAGGNGYVPKRDLGVGPCLREVWGQGPTSVFPAKGKGQQARDEGQTKAGARARRLEPEPCGRCNLQVVTSRGLEWISFLPFHAPVSGWRRQGRSE